jgi:hypothetical protein
LPAGSPIPKVNRLLDDQASSRFPSSLFRSAKRTR